MATDKDRAIAVVRKYLANHQPGEYALDVVPEASYLEQEWWHICVAPDREGIRRYSYYDVLAQVEREIEDEEQVNITLMPPPSGSSSSSSSSSAGI